MLLLPLTQFCRYDFRNFGHNPPNTSRTTVNGVTGFKKKKYLKYSCVYAKLWQVSKMLSGNAAPVDETFGGIFMTAQEQRAAY
jgi:hypothetical protein